jgi:hypothetical protein
VIEVLLRIAEFLFVIFVFYSFTWAVLCGLAAIIGVCIAYIESRKQ